jgi:hypothetical protein
MTENDSFSSDDQNRNQQEEEEEKQHDSEWPDSVESLTNHDFGSQIPFSKPKVIVKEIAELTTSIKSMEAEHLDQNKNQQEEEEERQHEWPDSVESHTNHDFGSQIPFSKPKVEKEIGEITTSIKTKEAERLHLKEQLSKRNSLLNQCSVVKEVILANTEDHLSQGQERTANLEQERHLVTAGVEEGAVPPQELDCKHKKTRVEKEAVEDEEVIMHKDIVILPHVTTEEVLETKSVELNHNNHNNNEFSKDKDKKSADKNENSQKIHSATTSPSS